MAASAETTCTRQALSRSRNLKPVMLAAVLMLLTLLLYNPVVHHDFVNYDDNDYVTANRHVRSGVTLQNIAWAFRSLEMSNWHPLTWLSHMLDSQLFGMNPAGHHYTNVLLHAANVCLLFFLLQRATGAVWRSAMVGALFALHPLNVETVAWVAERKSLLSFLFSLLMIAAYGWYSKAPDWKKYAVVAFCFALALMAKPMAVTVPAILLLLDYWPLGRFDGGDGFRRNFARLALEKTPLVIMSGASAWITMLAQRAGGSVALQGALPLAIRVKNAPVAYVVYLQKTFWPDKLSVFYPHPENALHWPKVIVAALALAALTAVVVRFRRERYLMFGWLVFLVTLVPVIGIVQVGRQAMADRYAYVPLIGIFIAIVWGGTALADKASISPAWRTLAAICVLSGTALAAHNALGYWQNSLTLFAHAEQVASRPDSVIEDNLGQALDAAGRPEQALRHFELARALNDRDPLARYNIATHLLRRGQMREAIPELQAALQFSNDKEVSASILNNLGVAYLELGDYEQAERSYSAGLALDPDRYHSLLGRGQAFYGHGRFADAARDFSHALAVRRDPVSLLWLGKALEAEGALEGARGAYREALQANPGLEEARARMAALSSR